MRFVVYFLGELVCQIDSFTDGLSPDCFLSLFKEMVGRLALAGFESSASWNFGFL